MKKVNFKLIGKILYGLVLAALILVAGLTAFSALKLPGSYKLMAVQSGSMEPAIKTGSVAVIQPMNDYKKDDVITFRDLEKPKVTTTHRIFEVKSDDGRITYISKGDANKSPDMGSVSKAQILGKVILAIPFLGYPIDFAKTREGLIILIIIPSVLIVYSELMNIKKEALKLLQERKNRKLSLKEKVEEKIGEEIIEVEKDIKKIVKNRKRKK